MYRGMSTPYHARLWAMELERRAEIGSSETFARALSDAKVDLNPHQVAAAMFAVRSPLAAGAILADEVGLVRQSRPACSWPRSGPSGSAGC